MPGEKAHAQAALKIFVADCVRKSLLDQSPMLRVERLPRTEPRSRILTDDELAAVLRATDGRFGAIVRLCSLLGQRRSEIAHLRADYIHDGLITLPASLTKNKREHTFRYGPMTAAIFETLPKEGYLFPACKTWRGAGTVYCAWNKDKPKLDKDWKTLKTMVPYCRQHMARLEKVGHFPQRVRLGNGPRSRTGWVYHEVVSWIEARMSDRERLHAGAPAE